MRRYASEGLLNKKPQAETAETITVEVGGRDSITADEEAKLRSYIIKATDPAFNVEIRPVEQIDWSANPKRLFFSSSVA